MESVRDAVNNARNIDPRMRNLGEGAVPFSLYPWEWNGDADVANFEAISQRGKVYKIALYLLKSLATNLTSFRF